MTHRFPVILCMLLALLNSCKNKKVSDDVQRYCKCLEEHQNDELGREMCIELMMEMKEKYADDGRALMQILEETDHCL